MELTKQTKPKKQRFKIIMFGAALLMCMSLFIFPMTAYASSARPVAPPSVEAEIVGSLLRIQAASGFYAVEAVYINERRFNHRVDSALVIDISQYIATGEVIEIYAVDFAGNYSNTVMLTPPVPAQPPVPNNLTPEGQGEMLDYLTNSDLIEFITVNTPSGSIFYLVIDHTRASNNIYFLNAVTEWDLMALAEEAGVTTPGYITPPANEPVVVEREPVKTETPTPEPTAEPGKKENGGTGIYIFLAIAGAVAFGAVYYLKIYKPKKERELYGGGDGEYEDENSGFEDIDESGEFEYTADSDTDSGGEDENV
jgi:hypothetical protein